MVENKSSNFSRNPVSRENNDNENQSDSDSDGEQAETQELSKFAALEALKNIKMFLQQRKIQQKLY